MTKQLEETKTGEVTMLSGMLCLVNRRLKGELLDWEIAAAGSSQEVLFGIVG